MAADPTDSIAATVANPERLRQFARWSAQDVIETCHRRGHDPDDFTREAVRKRADRDVDGDIAAEPRLGLSHTPEQAAEYRRLYVEAFVAAWYDPALRAEIRERFSHGFIIVCYR